MFMAKVVVGSKVELQFGQGGSSMSLDREQTPVIRLGSRVHMRLDDQDEEYRVVASEDAEPTSGLISMESPVGRALLGRAAGEEVRVRTPEGVRGLTVVSVE
jgi:transcription elongation GreA/GreB family factor